MKNRSNKSNKTRFISRVLLLTLLLTSALSLSACVFYGHIVWSWEVYSHKEFVEKIDEYNSKHDLYVDTVISFDLDNNEEVTKRIYASATLISTKDRGFIVEHGYICDIHGYEFPTVFAFYLKDDEGSPNDHAYKITCKRKIVDFNFTSDDNIEIIVSECTDTSDAFLDLIYEDSLLHASDNTDVYNYVYHYSMYANNALIACFHISSIEEASEEKLGEIMQMMYDSLVVINADGFYIWREQK